MRAFVCVCFALAACATTPASIRTSEPKAVYSTSKPEPALEQCLAESLSFLGGPAIVKGEASTSLQFGTGGITSLIVDLSPSSVTVRSGYPYAANLRSKVQACL